MRIQDKLKTGSETDEMNNVEEHKNGVMSDGSSPSSRAGSGRESSLAGHSTENLLESDESIDC